MALERTCEHCGTNFAIAAEDLAFYQRVGPRVAGQSIAIDPPRHCPSCRLQRRFAYRNERNLHRRDCDLCNRSMVSIYPTDAAFPVYCRDCWWGDGWNPLDYGIDFNPNESVLAQIHALRQCVPRLGLMNKAAENSEYCNYAGYNKNCYLASAGSWYNEDCIHGTYFFHSRDSLECYYLGHSELCYEANYCLRVYNCAFCLDCQSSNECFFSVNLIGCDNCFFCSNLRNKSNYIANRPASPEEIAALRDKMKSYSSLKALRERYLEFLKTATYPATIAINCEDCSGHELRNCRNVHDSFDVTDFEDGRYLFRCGVGKDMLDTSFASFDDNELCYEMINSGNGARFNGFCLNNWSSNDVYYCDTAMSCRNCFACVGVLRNQYVILNKQYSRAEYEELLPQVIEAMRRHGEWGEFFSIADSPFPYNETVAHEYFPLTEQQVCARGYSWRKNVESIKSKTSAVLPDRLEDVTEDLSKAVFACDECQKNYKLIAPELDLYRRLGIAPSRQCPMCRHRNRCGLVRHQLYSRNCGQCERAIEAVFAEGHPAAILCDSCYLEILC